MLVSITGDASWEEYGKAAPYLAGTQGIQVLANGRAYILCESGAELDTLYGQTVGDDGPTDNNPYSGPARVYALTCDPDGLIRTENT